MPTAKKTTSPKYNDVKTLLEWEAPGRPFIKRHKSYYTTSLLIMFFLEVILFLFSQYMLMLVVASLVFVAFALATVPPHNFKYRISSEGIFIEDYFYIWDEIYDFFFTKQHNQDVLILRTKAFLPGELTITLGDVSMEKIKHAILPYLPFREFIPLTTSEKLGNWMSKTFPLESPEANISPKHPTPRHKVA
jgi:hypothetical protein